MHKHIVITGAGAMGCLLAARLALSGNRVTVVDVDRQRLDRIAAEGIVLEDEAGQRIARVAAGTADEVTADGPDGPINLLILMTKGMHTRAAVRSVAHLAASGCCALTLQNGLGNAEILAETFTPDRVLWGVTDLPADLDGPNHVVSHGVGHIQLGGWTGDAQAHAAATAAMLDAAGLNAVADADVRIAVWEKVAFNAALNALATITGLTVGGMDSPEGRRIAGAVADETVATAAALGVPVDRVRLQARIDHALAHHRAHKASMLQDRLAGRMTEIESINGAIVAQADRAGVAAPVTRTLADLVRMGEPGRA